MDGIGAATVHAGRSSQVHISAGDDMQISELMMNTEKTRLMDTSKYFKTDSNNSNEQYQSLR